MFSLRPAQELIVFLGSPWLSDLVDIEAWGLSVHGYASHDAAVDLFQVLQLHKVAMNDLKALTQKLKSQRTSLRQANVSLKRQEAESRKLALIAARTDNAVILSDAQGRIEWVNEGFTRLTGYLLEEV
jgi:PAS domain-containing protein